MGEEWQMLLGKEDNVRGKKAEGTWEMSQENGHAKSKTKKQTQMDGGI